MIHLNQITPNEIISFQDVDKIFPMSVNDYLKRGDTFFDNKYEWFFVTNDKYKTDAERKTMISLICLTENWWDEYLENDLHISVFEVAAPIKNMGIGTEIMDYIIDMAVKYHYSSISLQVREPNLKHFYTKFGFREVKIGNIPFFILDLK